MNHALPILNVLLLGLLATSSASCEEEKTKVIQREDQPGYTGVVDRAMISRAIVQARKTHQEFLDALANRCDGCWGYEIKVPYPTPSGEEEHLWVGNVRWDGAQFFGSIASEPIDTEAVKQGDHVHAQPLQISDWKYVDGDQLVGGYTIRVVYSLSSPDDRKLLEAKYNCRIPPVDF